MHQQHPDLLQLAGLVVSAFRYFPLCCCPTSNDHKSCDPCLWFFLSLFRKASTGDGPREGELEDLHEDEPSSWVLLRAQRPLWIHLRLHSHLKVVPQCKRITKTRVFLFSFLGRSLSCDVHACFCAVELFYPQPMWGTRARLWIITGLFCWPETVLQAKTDEFFPLCMANI